MASTHTVRGPGSAARNDFNLKLPTTVLGKWSMWLAIVFIVAFAVNTGFIATSSAEFAEAQTWRQTVLPFYGIGMLLAGLSAGIVGLVAIFKQKERSLVTLLTVVPTVFVITFLAGEFLGPPH